MARLNIQGIQLNSGHNIVRTKRTVDNGYLQESTFYRFNKTKNESPDKLWKILSVNDKIQTMHNDLPSGDLFIYKAFGFSFNSSKALVLFLAVLVIFIFAYHKAIQNSIRNHPESALRVVQEYCRHSISTQLLGKIEKEEFSEKYQSCTDFHIKSVEASGGVFNPVIVRITVDGDPGWPMDKDVFIFKSIDMNLNFLSGLNRLISGRWEFNPYQTYSEVTFNGSF